MTKKEQNTMEAVVMDCGLLQMRKDGRFHLLSVRREVLAKFAPAILAERQDAPSEPAQQTH